MGLNFVAGLDLRAVESLCSVELVHLSTVAALAALANRSLEDGVHDDCGPYHDDEHQQAESYREH